MQKKSFIPSALNSIKSNLIVVGILILIIITSIIEPKFLTFGNLENILRQFGTLVFVALGMTFVIMGGFIDLSVSGIISLVVVVMVSLVDRVGQVNAILIGILIGLTCGFLNSLVIITCGALTQGEALFLTYGMGLVYAALALMYTKGATFFLTYAEKPITIFNAIGSGSVGSIPIAFIIFVVCLVILFIIQRWTYIGRSIIMIGENITASRLAGVGITKSVVFIYAVSGVMTAIGAVNLISRVTLASPVIGGAIGGGYETQAILAVVVGGTAMAGGRGSVLWTVIGTLVLTLMNNSLNLMGVSSYIQFILRGAILIMAILLDRQKQISEGK